MNKKTLKWLVPKFMGAFVLALGAINHKGKLPHTFDDWAMIAIAVGVGFSSGDNPKTKGNE